MCVPEAFVGPYPVKVRDEIRWMRYDTILKKTESFEKHDDVEDIQVGTMVQRKPLYAIVVGGAYDLVTPELMALCVWQHTSAIYNALEALSK